MTFKEALKDHEILVGQEVRTEGVEGENRTVKSQRPTSLEGRVTSHGATLFAYLPKLMEETLSEDQDPA